MHGIIPLLDSPMVLLQTIIGIFIGSMEHLVAQCFTHCSWVGGVPVRCYLLRGMANDGERLLEKLLSSLHIAFLAQTRIHQVAICINGAIKITPFPLDPYVGFIHVP